LTRALPSCRVVARRGSLLLGVAATIGLYLLGIAYEAWQLRGARAAEGGGAAALAAVKKKE
jgi:hypothetical protein